MADQSDSYYTVQPGDTFHSLAQFYYHDRNKWLSIRQVNLLLSGFGPDQPLPVGLRLTLPFIPELSTVVITEAGDTLHALAAHFYFSEDKWLRIRQANTTVQGFDADQPLPVGLQLTLPFIPERTIILTTIEGDTRHTLAKTYYDDENQWLWIGDGTLQGFDADQQLPVGLQLTLPFIPELTTAILIEAGDTLRSLSTIFYLMADDNLWLRIRQVNTPVHGFGPDQPLPVGLRLTLPAFTPGRVIITENGDTLRSLGQNYSTEGNYWLRIRQVNTSVYGFGPDQPLPVGLQLKLPPAWGTFRTFITGINDTFISLAAAFYQDPNKWPRIRQANPNLYRYNSNQPLPAGISVNIP